VVFFRHSSGVWARFQASRLQGQLGTIMPVRAIPCHPRYSALFDTIPYTIPCCSTLFHAMHHMLFHVILPCYSKLFHVIPHSRWFRMISYYSMLFHVIPSYSTLFHAIPCVSMWFHVSTFHSTLFQAIPYYSIFNTLFHVIPGYSTLFLMIPRYSTLSYAIHSFQTVGSRWLVAFVRHSLGMWARFRAFRMQQGQFDAVTLVHAIPFHVIPYDSMWFRVAPCYSLLFNPRYSTLFHSIP